MSFNFLKMGRIDDAREIVLWGIDLPIVFKSEEKYHAELLGFKSSFWKNEFFETKKVHFLNGAEQNQTNQFTENEHII